MNLKETLARIHTIDETISRLGLEKNELMRRTYEATEVPAVVVARLRICKGVAERRRVLLALWNPAAADAGITPPGSVVLDKLKELDLL